MLRGLLFVAGLIASGASQAQVSVSRVIDDVMVMPIQASDPSLETEAARLDEQLTAAIGADTQLTDISTVPEFTQQGYDARTYMRSCPPGQYAGCMLVVAQRVEMDWAIGGTLESASELGPGARQLTIHVVDISGSREVMAFGVVVGGGTDDSTVIAGVSGVFKSVLAGLADEVDVRGDPPEPEAEAAFEARRQRLIAASLAQLEQELGDVIREEIAMGRLEDPRLTRRDLAEYASRDDVAPWVRLKMSQAQYIRFENSGTTLLEWRRRLRGRFGQVLLRANVGGGTGPWGLHHEGRWLVDFDPNTSQFFDAAVRQYQEARRSGSSQLQFEVGFGVLPWLELSGVFGLKTAPSTYRFDQDVAEDPVSVPGKLIQTPSRTTELGVRTEFVPMPTYPIRPTLHAGFFSWKGGSIVPEQEPMVPLEGPRATYLQVGPGVEASAGRYLNLFLRGHADVLLSGTWFDERQDGDVGRLMDFEEPVGSYGGGWAVQGGFQVRIGLLPDPSGSAGAISGHPDDEEPDL